MIAAALLVIAVLIIGLVVARTIDRNDPVRHCELYRNMGCAHVDGPLCDMKTCSDAEAYRRFLG